MSIVGAAPDLLGPADPLLTLVEVALIDQDLAHVEVAVRRVDGHAGARCWPSVARSYEIDRLGPPSLPVRHPSHVVQHGGLTEEVAQLFEAVRARRA